MSPQSNRLNKDKEFEYVFKNGRSGYDKILGIKAAVNNLNINRFGILVSNKISKKAVERNKIRRRISEIIRLNSKKMKTGHDCVIISLPEIKNKNYKEIEESIIGNLKRLKLLV